MPRGKVHNKPFAGSAVRKDYHRPNRLENKGHRLLRGGARGLPDDSNPEEPVAIPHFSRTALIRDAVQSLRYRKGRRYDPRVEHDIEEICVNHLKHRCTAYRALVVRTEVEPDVYMSILQRVLDAIAENYPWLANECRTQFERRRLLYGGVRVVKKHLRSLTQIQVDEFNQCQIQSDGDVFGGSEEVPAFFDALSSLYQTRFIYTPPFLRPEEIRDKRFSGIDMNDHWWEWEKGMNFQDWSARLNGRNGGEKSNGRIKVLPRMQSQFGTDRV